MIRNKPLDWKLRQVDGRYILNNAYGDCLTLFEDQNNIICFYQTGLYYYPLSFETKKLSQNLEKIEQIMQEKTTQSLVSLYHMKRAFNQLRIALGSPVSSQPLLKTAYQIDFFQSKTVVFPMEEVQNKPMGCSLFKMFNFTSKK